jgi:hypothetical protein
VRGLLKIGISLDGITKFQKNWQKCQLLSWGPGASFGTAFVSQKDKNGH